MGVVDWFCRTLCKKEIAREAARVREEQESELEMMKREAARKTNAVKARRHARTKLAKLGLGSLIVACHSLTPEQQARVDVFECRVAAVAPLVESFVDPTELVRDVMLGKVNPTQALIASGAKPADVIAAARAWNACAPAAPVVEGS